jgi:subtilisin family serine protease
MAKPVSKYDTHGTLVAGVIFASHNNFGANGIAPKSSFIAIRQPYNTTSQTILAFTLAKLAKADIINCSWNSPHLLEPVYDVLNHYTKDIAIVFSAGNNSKRLIKNKTEASMDSVITVGNSEQYSNYGEIVDIKTYSHTYTTKAGGGYVEFSGTSASAPIVTGLLALYLSSGLSLQEAIKNIKEIKN